MASWTAGLVVGVTLLVTNNPTERLPQLSYPQLTRHLLWPLAVSVLLASAFGMLAATQSQPFVDLLHVNVRETKHPVEVTVVWVTHIGTYLGAIAGLVVAAVRIRRERLWLTPPRAP